MSSRCRKNIATAAVGKTVIQTDKTFANFDLTSSSTILVEFLNYRVFKMEEAYFNYTICSFVFGVESGEELKRRLKNSYFKNSMVRLKTHFVTYIQLGSYWEKSVFSDNSAWPCTIV